MSNDLSRLQSPDAGRLLSRLSAAGAGGNAVASARDRCCRRTAVSRTRCGVGERIRGTRAAAGRRFEPDGAEFAAALFGAWYARKTVYLPADALPATCRALAAREVVFAGGFPAEFAAAGIAG